MMTIFRKLTLFPSTRLQRNFQLTTLRDSVQWPWPRRCSNQLSLFSSSRSVIRLKIDLVTSNMLSVKDVAPKLLLNNCTNTLESTLVFNFVVVILQAHLIKCSENVCGNFVYETLATKHFCTIIRNYLTISCQTLILASQMLLMLTVVVVHHRDLNFHATSTSSLKTTF